MMKLCVGKVYFQLPQHRLLIPYPFFRDYWQQFYKLRNLQPYRYLRHVAVDNRTTVFVFPSAIANYKAIAMKIRKGGITTQPLLQKIVIYPVVRPNIRAEERFFRKKRVSVIYAYVQNHTPMTLKDFLMLMNKVKRQYAFMYVSSLQEIERLKRYDFELIVLDAKKLSEMGSTEAYNFILDALKLIEGK